MKKLLFLFAFLLPTQLLFGQLKIGYVDSEYIMDQLPDAQDAETKLDAIIQEWQEELQKLKDEWQTAYDDYEERKLIMSDQKRIETERELINMEEKINDFRQKKFGVNGELFKKQNEVMKPIQNKIFTAIEEVAEEEDYDYIFDRSGDIIFLYAKDEHDVTNLVLEKLQ